MARFASSGSGRVLPGNGGFFDADLDIEFAGGANGAWQIPMFDCTVA